MIIPKETPKIFVSGTTGYSPGETECDAEYSYYERGDQRIKHGKFVYRYIGYSGGIYSNWISGAYTDGKKSGQWIFTTGNGLYLDLNGNLTSNKQNRPNYYAIVTYKDDILSGPFEMRAQTYRDYYDISIKGNIKDNHPSGLLNVEINRLGSVIRIEGKFNENGHPDGMWKIDRKTGIQTTQIRTFSDGKLIKVTEFDLSTGETNVLYDNTHATIFTNNLNEYKKIEREVPNSKSKTFYKSKDGHYFTANQVSIFGESIGDVFRKMEYSLSSIDDTYDKTLGVDIGYLYILTPVDEEAIERDDILKKKVAELRDRLIVLFDGDSYYYGRGRPCKFTILKEANALAVAEEINTKNILSEKTAEFYVAADEIIVDYLRFNPESHEDLTGTWSYIKDTYDNMTYETIKEVESQILSLENSLKEKTELANKVETIRKNIKTAYQYIDKKSIKLHYQKLVDGRDAQGLIELFTEGYKKHMP